MAQRNKKQRTTRPERPSRITRIHAGKTPMRRHFIAERAELLGLRQVDFVEEMGVDKGTVSKWFGGSIPQGENLDRVAAILQLEEVGQIFDDPNDDWLTRMLRGRSKAQKDTIRRMLEAGFGTGTDG
jgi:hypothetical protein